MTFFDLFAGIGGFRLALERAGHTCVGFCEIDKFARQTYKANFNTEGEVEWHDITTVTDEAVRRIGNVDIITGGFPCQAFSVAGKRGGFNDTRGTLFFEIARIARILRPRYLLLENVKGLLNHARGDTFFTILNTLAELGYWWEYQVLNSKDFGVPQNRERVFIVGHLGGKPRRKVFPITRTSGQAVKQIGNYIDTKSFGGNPQRGRVYAADGISPCLNGIGSGGNLEPKVMIIRSVLTPDRAEKHQNGRRFKEPGEPMFTLTAQDRDGGLIKHKPEVRAVALQNANMQGRRIKEEGEPSFTISATDRHGVMVRQTEDGFHLARNDEKKPSGVRIRRLTPLECFRLQGFPDEYFHNAKAAGVSDSQLYKQAGNAVTVNVVYEIVKRLG